MIKKIYIFIILNSSSLLVYSQIGIGTSTPLSTLHVKESRTLDNANDINSKDGIIIPKLTKAELALKINSAYLSPDQEGALVYITDISGNISGPSANKVLNINSPGFYFLNNQSLWEPISGVGVDNSNDAWTNNPSQSRVELGSNSFGSPRTTGTEVVVTDNGNLGINVLNPLKRLEINAANNTNATDFIKLQNLSFPPINTITNTLQIDDDGYISRRQEENIEGKILRLPLAIQNGISNAAPRILTTETNSFLSPNLTPNLITLIPGYVRNNSNEFTLPAGLYKYEVRLIGYFSKEDPKNSISLTTYVNNIKHSVHFYGSNTRAGYFTNGNANQNYTSLIKSDFLELKQSSLIKFEVTNFNTTNFNVINYVAISGQRSYRSVILFQRIK